jgi:hypothetical protein
MASTAPQPQPLVLNFSDFSFSPLGVDTGARNNENPLSDGGNWYLGTVTAYNPELVSGKFQATETEFAIAWWNGRNAIYPYSLVIVGWGDCLESANVPKDQYCKIKVNALSAIGGTVQVGVLDQGESTGFQLSLTSGQTPNLTLSGSYGNYGITIKIPTPPFTMRLAVANNVVCAFVNDIPVIAAYSNDPNLVGNGVFQTREGLAFFSLTPYESISDTQCSNWEFGLVGLQLTKFTPGTGAGATSISPINFLDGSAINPLGKQPLFVNGIRAGTD